MQGLAASTIRHDGSKWGANRIQANSRCLLETSVSELTTQNTRMTSFMRAPHPLLPYDKR